MFESFTQKQKGRGKRLSTVLMASLFFHGIVVAVILFVDHMRIDAVPQPPVMITFVDYAALPPPPLPRRSPRRSPASPTRWTRTMGAWKAESREAWSAEWSAA